MHFVYDTVYVKLVIQPIDHSGDRVTKAAR